MNQIMQVVINGKIKCHFHRNFVWTQDGVHPIYVQLMNEIKKCNSDHFVGKLDIYMILD